LRKFGKENEKPQIINDTLIISFCHGSKSCRCIYTHTVTYMWSCESSNTIQWPRKDCMD